MTECEGDPNHLSPELTFVVSGSDPVFQEVQSAPALQDVRPDSLFEEVHRAPVIQEVQSVVPADIPVMENHVPPAVADVSPRTMDQLLLMMCYLLLRADVSLAVTLVKSPHHPYNYLSYLLQTWMTLLDLFMSTSPFNMKSLI